MKMSRTSQGLALAAVLMLSSSGAFAAAGELRALSETEMSDVHAQGLSLPALDALSMRAQSDASVPAADAAPALAALSGDLQNLDRQLAQQRLQAATTGVQATLLVTQAMLAADRAAVPIAVTLPFAGLALLAGLPVGLPALASLATLPGKH